MMTRFVMGVAVAALAATGCGGSTTLTADGGGGAGAAGDGGGGGGSETQSSTHTFSVTVENDTGETIFVDGLYLPFAIERGGADLKLGSGCPCEVCLTGESCLHPHTIASAAELPPGASISLAIELNWYQPEPVTKSECPEADFETQCDWARTFEPGPYLLVIEHDDQAAIDAQGMEATDRTMWGATIWETWEAQLVTLTKRTEQTFELDGDTSSLTVSITP